jgi:hypothetical protein
MSDEAQVTSRRCTATTRAGSPCRGYAVVGDDFCVFHTSKERVRALRPPAVISSLEMLKVLTLAIRRLSNTRGPGALDRAREIRSLVALVQELQGEGKPSTPDVDPPTDITSRIEKWKNKNRP